MSLPVAIQLYTLRDEMEKDVRGTLEKVKEFGYDGVEFAGLFGYSAADMKKMLDEIGLKAVSAHVALKELLPDMKNVIATYKEIGCEYIAIPYLPGDRRPEAGDFDSTIADIRAIGEECKNQGVILLYHNHDFEFKMLGDKYVLDVLYDSIPADLLQTEIDTCWVNVGGVDPAEYILKYKDRSPVVHLKDFTMKSKGKPSKLYELIGIQEEADADEEDFSFRPVGHGVQDMPSILAAAEKAGSKWLVVEQDRPAKHNTPLESAKMSRDYLKALGY
ncbi:MAG: sugar phosphate isomerase/epimerase [Clostridiales bacterium]|jgi:sugar phosphate isomerase/epimerase|nr:sugar phosphate isomerase/epimerase [Clostridiales bacterium]